MSNAKETLNRVMTALGMKPEATIEVEMAQKKTADGTIVLDSESFAIGEPVFIVTEEGNIPVPMGQYVLEDGVTIETDEMGIIVEVSTEEEVTEEITEEVEAEDVPMKEEKGEMTATPKKVVKSKTEMEESYFSKIEARLSAIEANNETLKAENVKLSEENEELKKALASEPAPHAKFNPDAQPERVANFKIGARRQETIADRVFNQLFS